MSSSLTSVVSAPRRLSSARRTNSSVQINRPTELFPSAIQQIILEYLNYTIGNLDNADFYFLYRRAFLNGEIAPFFLGYNTYHKKQYDRLSVIVLLQYVVKNKEEEMAKMLRHGPELALYAETVMGYSCFYEGTAFQLALAAHNIEMAMSMMWVFRFAFSQPTISEDCDEWAKEKHKLYNQSELPARAEMKRQYEERYSAEEKKRAEERAASDDAALQAVAQAIYESTNNACSLALEARDAFDHPATLESWFNKWKGLKLIRSSSGPDAIALPVLQKLILHVLSVVKAAQAINGDQRSEEFEEPEDEKRQAQTQATLQLLNQLKNFRSYLNKRAFETRKAGEHFNIPMLIKACEMRGRNVSFGGGSYRENLLLFDIQVIGRLELFLPAGYESACADTQCIVRTQDPSMYTNMNREPYFYYCSSEARYQLGLDLAFSPMVNYLVPATNPDLAEDLKKLYDAKTALFFKLKESLGIHSASQDEQKPKSGYCSMQK